MFERKKISLNILLLNTGLYLLALIYIIPFLISLAMSMKTKEETVNSLLSLPESFYMGNFAQAIEKAKIFQSFMNSVVVTVSCVVIIIFCTSMAGYGIGRFYHKKTMRLYELLLLTSLMVPFQTIMIPLYKLLKATGLMNTLLGVILAISGTSLAFATMMYIGFVKTMPIELEEAAFIEGCGRFQTYLRVVFPLLKPITFSVATLHTLWIWNEFAISLIVLQKDKVKTIPMQQYVFFSQYTADYNLAFAAAIVTMVPIIVFFIYAQKYIVRGLSEGAVKG